jgi:hypothetical protein
MWPENCKRSDGCCLDLEFLKSGGSKGCQAEDNIWLATGCCAWEVLANEPDFQAQRGQLAEELEKLNEHMIFYPKFHLELNFIERFWCVQSFMLKKTVIILQMHYKRLLQKHWILFLVL